jgi:hypothetical protein
MSAARSPREFTQASWVVEDIDQAVAELMLRGGGTSMTALRRRAAGANSPSHTKPDRRGRKTRLRSDLLRSSRG